MWQTIKSIVKFLLQLIVVGIVILIINVLPDGAKDIVTTICFIIAFFLIYLFFAKQIDDLDYRVAGLELQLEETKEEFEGWKKAHW